MAVFLSTAFNYVKGQSGLPSMLPARDSISLAKENSRGVRLFCKGLENFREIFYTDDQNSCGSMGAVTKVTAKQEAITPATPKQDQSSRDSIRAVAAAMPDQGLKDEKLIQGDLIFQSLFEAEETPPGSPGSTTSSSTLVNPQSRKVSPTVVKDFAYPDPDSKEIYDPVAIIGEETKKELLKQLHKKTATEEKVSQENEKLTARNKILGAELESMKAIVQGRDVRADFAKVHANALTLSNFVLRQVMQDLSHELSLKKDGAQIQGPRSQEKTPWNQEMKEVADEYGASAYGRIVPSENALVERAHCLDDLQDQGILQREDKSPIGKAVHLKRKEPRSTAVEYLGQDALDKTQAGGILEIYGSDPAAFSNTLTSPSPIVNIDMDFTDASGPATLWGILASIQGEDPAKDTADAGEQTADFSEVEAEPYRLKFVSDEHMETPTPPNTAVASPQNSTNGVDSEGHGEKDDHEPRDMVAGSPSVAPTEGTDQSGVVHAPSLAPACTPASPSRASSSAHVEETDVINPVPRSMELSATQKRRAERKRKVERERERKKLEGAAKRVAEEEGVKAPEVSA